MFLISLADHVQMTWHYAICIDDQAFVFLAVGQAVDYAFSLNQPGENVDPSYNCHCYEVGFIRLMYPVITGHVTKLQDEIQLVIQRSVETCMCMFRKAIG